jgi:hypothetical protein
LEMYKLWFEAYKNQPVLSSGAVVAYAAVTAVLIPNPTFLWMLGLSHVCLLASIAATIWVMRETALITGKP